MSLSNSALLDLMQDARSRIDSTDSHLSFKGTCGTKANLFEIENAKLGDVFYCTDEVTNYVYSGKEWLPLGKVDSLSSESAKEVKKHKCDCCGAPLPVSLTNSSGICRCSYCLTDHYVW